MPVTIRSRPCRRSPNRGRCARAARELRRAGSAGGEVGEDRADQRRQIDGGGATVARIDQVLDQLERQVREPDDRDALDPGREQHGDDGRNRETLQPASSPGCELRQEPSEPVGAEREAEEWQ